MKYLVKATPIAPVTDKAILDELVDWIHDQQRSGRITAAYGMVGGGGCSVMDVDSPQDLHELTALCPIGSHLSFEITPLIDLDRSLDLGRDRLRS